MPHLQHKAGGCVILTSLSWRLEAKIRVALNTAATNRTSVKLLFTLPASASTTHVADQTNTTTSPSPTRLYPPPHRPHQNHAAASDVARAPPPAVGVAIPSVPPAAGQRLAPPAHVPSLPRRAHPAIRAADPRYDFGVGGRDVNVERRAMRNAQLQASQADVELRRLNERGGLWMWCVSVGSVKLAKTEKGGN